MSDFKISDSAAQTRGLDEFRHLDQQERLHADRVNAMATNNEIKEESKNIDESERTVSDREEENSGGANHQAKQENEEPEEEKKAPAPIESSEGHLLDLKA